jgi:hypothetical protein
VLARVRKRRRIVEPSSVTGHREFEPASLRHRVSDFREFFALGPGDARVRDILPLKGSGEMANSSKSRKSQVFSLRVGSPVLFLANQTLSLHFVRASREMEGAREFESGSINREVCPGDLARRRIALVLAQPASPPCARLYTRASRLTFLTKPMRCSNCKTENPRGKKFCGDCGTALGNRRSLMSGVETDGKNVLLVVDDNADPRKPCASF